MRISPAPSRIPQRSQPPADADCAQATVTAGLLARLIGECNERLASLNVDAEHATESGEFAMARHLDDRARNVRCELDELRAMDHRLARRFFGAAPLTVVPPA